MASSGRTASGHGCRGQIAWNRDPERLRPTRVLGPRSANARPSLRRCSCRTDVERRRDLGAPSSAARGRGRPCRSSAPGGQVHRAGVFGVNRGHGAIVAGVHGCSMSKASPPRTSPTMIRSGRMRRAFFTSSRWRIFAAAFHVGRTRLHAGNVNLLQLQLGRVFDGDDALAPVDMARHRVQQSSSCRSPFPPR